MVEIKEGMKVESNCVFVIPPNAFVEMDGCYFRLKPMDAQAMRKAIDTFFCSVAADQGDNVVGVILSGTGLDGAYGLRFIKDHGGLTIAQTPATARVLRECRRKRQLQLALLITCWGCARWPDIVCKYAAHLDRLHQRKTSEAIQREADGCLPKIFELLREKDRARFQPV